MRSVRTRALLGLLVTAGLLPGCQEPPQPPITLTLWHSLPSHEARVLEELVAPLQVAHPDWQLATETKQPETVLSRLGGAEGPDAALVPLAAVRSLIRDHRVLPLDAHLSERDRLDFLPAVWKHVTRDGHTWAVPFEVSTLALFYNRALLTGTKTPVPATTAEVMLRGITFHAKTPLPFFMSLPTEPATLMPFVWGFGGTVATDDHWQAATRYLLTLRGRGVIGPFQPTAKGSVTALAERKAAMAIGAPEHLPLLTGLMASGDLGIAPLPNGSDSVHTPMVGRVWVVSPKADRLDAALAAVSVLSNRESAAVWNARLNHMPARLSAYEEPLISQRPALATLRDQAANAHVIGESDMAAVAALAPQWRPYLNGEKKLPTPRPAVTPSPTAPGKTH